MTAYREIAVKVADRVAAITLNRPDRLNAWTAVMAGEVQAAVEAAGADPAVRCITITGAGRGFCAGADMDGLGEIAARGGAEGGMTPEAADSPAAAAPGPSLEVLYPGRFGYFFSCPKPILAASNGPCAGIGLIMTLYADMRFAAAEAKFTTAFAARGLIAEHGIAWLLPRLVGEAHALDLLLSARKFDGAEAAAMGLVNAALPGEALGAHVAEVARRLAHDVSPRSVAVMKAQVRRSLQQGFAESLAEADAQMAASFASADMKEGLAHYLERRPPAFPDL